METAVHINDLPHEVLERIFSFCDGCSLKSAFSSCALWNSFGGEDCRLWEAAATKYYNALSRINAVVTSPESPKPIGCRTLYPPNGWLLSFWDVMKCMTMTAASDLTPLEPSTPKAWRQYLTLLASCSFVKPHITPGKSLSLDAVERDLSAALVQHGSLFQNRVFDSIEAAMEQAKAAPAEFSKYRRVICLLPTADDLHCFVHSQPILKISEPMSILGPECDDNASTTLLRVPLQIELSAPGLVCCRNMAIQVPADQPDTDAVSVSGPGTIVRMELCGVESTSADDEEAPIARISVRDGGRLNMHQCALNAYIDVFGGGYFDGHTCSLRGHRGSIKVREQGAFALAESVFESGKNIFEIEIPFDLVSVSNCSHRRIFQEDSVISNVTFMAVLRQLKVSVEELIRNKHEGVASPALLARITGCIETAATVCRENDRMARWTAQDGVSGLLQLAMANAPYSSSIQAASAKILWAFACTESLKKYVGSIELAQLLVAALEKFGPADSAIAESTVATLANLCLTRPGPNKYNPKLLRAHLSTESFLKTLLSILSTHRRHKTLADACLMLLWGISAEPSAVARDRVFALGGLDLFFELLSTCSDIQGMASMIVGSISSMIITDANRELFTKKGGLKVMHTLLQDADSENADAVREVCVFLRAFCYANDKIPMKEFKEIGLLKTLSKICENDHISIEIKENAVAALANFASCSEECKITLRDEGGLRPLLWLLKIVDFNDEEQANMKMGAIIGVCHMSSQVDLSSSDLREIQNYWMNTEDLLDVIFSPNDVKFVLHTREPEVKMMALWCTAHIALEEPPVGSSLTWKKVYEVLQPFIQELRTRGAALSKRERQIVVTALDKLKAFGVNAKF